MSSRNPKKPEPVPFPGLCDLLRARKVAAVAAAEVRTLETRLAQVVRDQWVRLAVRTGGPPPNWSGAEGPTRASIETRRRGSALPPDAVAILTDAGIPLRTDPVRYQVAPGYAADTDLFARVRAAIADAGLPVDLFDELPGATFADDATVKAVAKHKDAAVLLPLVSSVAIKFPAGQEGGVE